MTPQEFKNARTSMGLSQQAFADALDMTRRHIGRMERGESTILRKTGLAVELLVIRHRAKDGAP